MKDLSAKPLSELQDLLVKAERDLPYMEHESAYGYFSDAEVEAQHQLITELQRLISQ